MDLSRDTEMHVYGGLVVAIALAALIGLSTFTHPSVALAVAGPLFGWGVERYQAIRRAGAVERRDMIATALPFEVVALLLWMLL
mgnify:CR=1 FL=1